MSAFEILLQIPAVHASEEDIEAQRQWIETGTVSLDYLASRCGESMQAGQDPILSLVIDSTRAATGESSDGPPQNVDRPAST